MTEKIQITIEIPFGYAQRDQLLDYMKSKFPAADIAVMHAEVDAPAVSDAIVQREGTAESAEQASQDPGEDSGSMLTKATEALANFTK
ncbi:MAG: hypothetical protein JO279_01195 [Verrucomicrobia bacterium]|nr:hypothetical protein [Verrucomicrobiota bacterium]